VIALSERRLVMKAVRLWKVGLAALAAAAVVGGRAMAGDETPVAAVRALAEQRFDFTAPRTAGPRYWTVTTTMIPYSLEGKRDPKIIYRLKLKGEIVAGQDTYTCLETTLRVADGEEVSIPSLAGWSYPYQPDDAERTLGIPHEPFQGLTDSSGAAVPMELTHPIYNQFIDFHAFCDVFARPSEPSDITDLKKVGDHIVHNSANSRGSVALGDVAGEGSYFQNGEITLTFKGVTVLDDVPCAIVGYDSGESSLQMNTEPMPGMRVDIVGTSHYFGDIYIDLESMWVVLADMEEFVVTNVMMGPQKVGGQPVERTVVIRAATAAEVGEN
jgi:hypothetical protein